MRHAVVSAVFVFLLLFGRPAQADTVHIRVSSELWPDEASAIDEANQRLFDKLLAVVSVRAGESLTQDELRRQLPRLLTAREAQREESTEKVVKPYGLMFRQFNSVRISDEAIARWVADVAQERQIRLHQRIGAGVLTLLGWLIGLCAVVRLDRWTNGYRREVIFSSTFGVVLVLTGYLWLILWT